MSGVAKNENVVVSVKRKYTRKIKVPTNIVAEPVEVPTNIIAEPVDAPINIFAEPINVPTNIVVEPVEVPTNIVVEPVNVPTNIVVEPVEVPTNIVVEPVEVPTNIVVEPLTKEQKKLKTEAVKAERAKKREQKHKDRLRKIEDDANSKIALLQKKQEMEDLITLEKNKFNIVPNNLNIVIKPIGKSKTFKEAFGTDKLIEPYNTFVAKYILQTWDEHANKFNIYDNDNPLNKYDPKILLECFIKSSKNNDYISTKYNKSVDKNNNFKKYGRWFADKSLSFQSMPRLLRGSLCRGLWIDLDFKNCHPVILEQLCIYYGIPCEFLHKYNTNREEMLKDIINVLGCSRDDAKKWVLKTLNGGNVNINIKWWGLLKNEFKNIAEKRAIRPEFDNIYSSCISVKKENINARVMNCVLCIYENMSLENLYSYLTENNIIQGFKCSLIFDGLQVIDNPYNRQILSIEFLKSASECVKEQTGLYLELDIKDFNEFIEIPEGFLIANNKNIIESNDDVRASKYVLDVYKHLYIKCNGVYYVKNNNIWCYNPDTVKKIIYQHIQDTNIFYYNAKSELITYSNSVKSIKNCFEMIMVNGFSENDDFIKNSLKNTKYFVPFLDGIYSFKDKKLYKYDDLPNIHFTQQINRYFPKYNERDHNELMTRVLNPIYPNETEKKHFLHITSRGLAGCYTDKKWYAGSGARNSGKSVTYKLFVNAFGCYVRTFNANSLISTKFGDDDASKKLGWCVDVKDARLIISSEVGKDDENIKLNGNFIKSLASGGDEMVGRLLYQNNITFTPQFTMILFCNKLPEISPIDAMENLEQFNFKSQFVSEEDLLEGISYLKLKDDGVKELLIEDRILDAFTLAVLDEFNMNRRDTPEEVKISNELGLGDIVLKKERFILTNFKTTTDKNDRKHTEDSTYILNKNGYNLDKIDAGRLFNQLGIGKYNSKTNIEGVRKGGYEYVKYIGEEDV